MQDCGGCTTQVMECTPGVGYTECSNSVNDRDDDHDSDIGNEGLVSQDYHSVNGSIAGESLRESDENKGGGKSVNIVT